MMLLYRQFIFSPLNRFLNAIFFESIWVSTVRESRGKWFTLGFSEGRGRGVFFLALSDALGNGLSRIAKQIIIDEHDGQISAQPLNRVGNIACKCHQTI